MKRESIRVANVTEEARWGGPQVRISSVAPRLPEDIETTVVFPERDSERFVEELERHAIERAQLPMNRLSTHPPALFRYVKGVFPEIWALKRTLERRDIDLVHANGCWQIKGMVAAKLAGIPAVWHLNDTYMPAPVRAVFYALAPFVADGFILASRRTREYYLDRASLRSKPSKVIQAPVDTEEFDPARIEAHPMIADKPGLKVTTVATINPIKGIEYFIDMADRVSSRLDREIQFFVVGPVYDSQRDYGRRMKALAEERGLENLHFTGHCDDVPGVLAASDIYVCSSLSEASPISIWEAMAMGRAIVSTDVGDVRHHFESEQGVNRGLVTPVEDAEALAEAVASLAENSPRRAAMGREARRFAREHLDLEICARRHAEMYRRMVG